MTARRADTGMTTHENGDQTVSDERDLKSHQIMELSRAIERVTALADELDTEGAATKALGRRYQDENRWVGAASCESKAWTSSDAARRLRAAIAGPR